MDRGKLTRDQRHALMREIETRRNWVHRLHMRMRAQNWNEGCPSYLATLNAYEAMHKLLGTFKIDPTETPADWMKHIGK